MPYLAKELQPSFHEDADEKTFNHIITPMPSFFAIITGTFVLTASTSAGVLLAAAIPPRSIPTILNTVQELVDIVDTLTDWLFVILSIVAVIFIVLAGFQFVTAGGNPEAIAQARRKLLYATVGIVVALLAGGVPLVITNILSGVVITQNGVDRIAETSIASGWFVVGNDLATNWRNDTVTYRFDLPQSNNYTLEIQGKNRDLFGDMHAYSGFEFSIDVAVLPGPSAGIINIPAKLVYSSASLDLGFLPAGTYDIMLTVLNDDCPWCLLPPSACPGDPACGLDANFQLHEVKMSN